MSCRGAVVATLCVGLLVFMADLGAAHGEDFSPGAKVIVDSYGEHDGEIIDKTSTGEYRVRYRSGKGEVFTTLPPSRIRLANGQRAKKPDLFAPRYSRHGLPGPAAAAADPATRDKALLGAWIADSHQLDHRIFPGSESFIFRPEGCTYRIEDLPYSVDPKAKPKRIDIGPPGSSTAGIYEIDGDTLRLCVNDMSSRGGRPTDFTPKEGEEFRMFVCRRVTEQTLAKLVRDEVGAMVDGLIADLDAKQYDRAAAKLSAHFEFESRRDQEEYAVWFKSQISDLRKVLTAIKKMEPEIDLYPLRAVYEFEPKQVPNVRVGSAEFERRGKAEWSLNIDWSPPRAPPPDASAGGAPASERPLDYVPPGKSASARYLRFKKGDAVSYGLVEGDRVRRLDGDLFGKWSKTETTYALTEVEFLPPTKPTQVLGVAMNYRLGEEDQVPPRYRVVQPFLKSPSSLIPTGAPIVLPRDSGPACYQAGMVLVIGKRCSDVSRERALDYVFGVTCGNDITEMGWHREREGDVHAWRANGADTFGPVGPFIATGLDFDNLQLTLRLNGQVEQNDHTSRLLHNIPKLVSYISRYVTLEPGDLIFTGTPKGVDTIRDGDVLEVELEGVGLLRNTVAREGARCPKCGAVHLASEFSAEEKQLLSMNAELAMLRRVETFEFRHPQGVQDRGGPNWTDEDEQIAEYLKHRIFSLDKRLTFVMIRSDKLARQVGNGLRCRRCKEAYVEIGSDDHNGLAGDW